MEKNTKKDRQYGLYFQAGLVQPKEKQGFEWHCFWKNNAHPCTSTFIGNWGFGPVSAEGEKKGCAL